MNEMMTLLANRPIPSIGAATGTSATGVYISFHTAVEVVQILGGLIAIVSGLIGIAIGAWHLREIWRKERARKNDLGNL